MIVPVSTFVAGGFVLLSLPGPVLSILQYFSPNHLAQTAIFNTIYGGAATKTMAPLGAMLMLIVITFAVAMVSERRMAN